MQKLVIVSIYDDYRRKRIEKEELEEKEGGELWEEEEEVVVVVVQGRREGEIQRVIWSRPNYWTEIK